MNKELEALEKINHTICLNVNKGTLVFNLDKYDNCDCKDIKEFSKCYNAVETALKDQQKTIKVLSAEKTILSNNYNELKDRHRKQLKALEIIKKLFEIKISKNKLGQCFVSGKDGLFAISQEEYELLKEVLL